MSLLQDLAVWQTSFFVITCVGFLAGLLGGCLMPQKKILSSEVFSHVSYPAAILASIPYVLLQDYVSYEFLLICIVFPSFYLSQYLLDYLSRLFVSTDVAMTWLIGVTMGVGIYLVSILQFSIIPNISQQANMFLFGDVLSVLSDELYYLLGVNILFSVFVITCRRWLIVYCMDESYANQLFINSIVFKRTYTVMTSMAMIMCIKSCGVLMITAFVTSSAVISNQGATRFIPFVFLSGFTGACFGLLGMLGHLFLGNVYLVRIPPGILAVFLISTCALVILLIHPKTGWLVSTYRRIVYNIRCEGENILKSFIRSEGVDFNKWYLDHYYEYDNGRVYGYVTHIWLRYCRYIRYDKNGIIELTVSGESRGNDILRKHRLWELYLTTEIGAEKKDVHYNAEQVEHILKQENVDELNRRLNHPTKDPHDQDIP